jgi:hypothetical protein
MYHSSWIALVHVEVYVFSLDWDNKLPNILVYCNIQCPKTVYIAQLRTWNGLAYT